MLRPKQQRFVEEYLVDLNATQAAIRAGYSKKTAQAISAENLRKPLIAEAIKKEMDKRSQETKIDAAWVLKKAASLAEKCERDGDTYNPSAAVAALNLVAKHVDVNALADKNIDVKHDGELVVRWENGRDSNPV